MGYMNVKVRFQEVARGIREQRILKSQAGYLDI